MSSEITKQKNYSLTKGLGITGLVLGIIGLIVSFIPCFGAFAIYIGGLGLIIASIALLFAIKNNLSKGLIIAAVIISLISCIIAYWQSVQMMNVANSFNESFKESNKELQEELNAIDKEFVKEMNDINDDIIVSNTNSVKTNNIKGKYPQASQRHLDADDMMMFSKEDLSLMRNEIFARHGYIFKSGGEMYTYFKKQKWYTGTKTNVDHLLTKIEKYNIDLITTAENSIVDNLETMAGGYGNILVENLRLRDTPNLEGKTLELLKKDAFVNVKEESNFKTTVEIGGKQINDVWFKIVSETGKIGWVHGCCIEVTWP